MMSIITLHEVEFDNIMNSTDLLDSMNSTLPPLVSDGMQGMIAIIQYVFTSIAIVVSFVILVEISWKHGPRSKHPANLFVGIYIVDAFLLCIFGAVFCGYAIVFWKMEASGYDALPLFWTGFPLSIIVGSIHITVQFLAFDRLVAILRPSDFLIGNKVMARILGVICVSGQLCYAVNTTGIVMQDRPMESKPTHCYAFICLVSNSRIVVYLLYRTIFGGLNIILGWTMYLVLKRNRSSIGRKERRNIASRIAITTFLCGFVFDFLPHLVVVVVYFTTQSNVLHCLGPFSGFFGALEVAASLLFWRESFARVREKYSSKQRRYQLSTISRTQLS